MAVSRVNGGRGGRSVEAEVACGVGVVFVVVSVMIADAAPSIPFRCAARPSPETTVRGLRCPAVDSRVYERSFTSALAVIKAQCFQLEPAVPRSANAPWIAAIRLQGNRAVFAD